MSYDFKAYVSQAKNFIHFRDEDKVKSKKVEKAKETIKILRKITRINL